MKRCDHHNGFTLLELIVVVGVVGILAGLLLPAVQAAREAARRMSCSNNLRQVALAVAQYHHAFDILPPHGTGTFNNANDPATTNQFRLSFLVSITPFVGETPTWKSISGEHVGIKPNEAVLSGNDFASMMTELDEAESPEHRYPRMGPAPYVASYGPWGQEVSIFRCPSDPGYGAPGLGRTNYVACLGDAIEGLDEGLWRYKALKWSPSGETQMRATGRGMFVPRMITSLDDVTDGLSSTIMLGEIATDLVDKDVRTMPSLHNGWAGGVLDDVQICRGQIQADRPLFWRTGSSVRLPPSNAQGRGLRWADAMPLMTGFNTTLPPNAELCFGGDSTTIGTLPPSSRHQGGAHFAMGDGSVNFLTDSIDAGYSKGTVTLDGKDGLAPGSPSEFGIWGAMGTRDQNELIGDGWF